LALPTVVCGEGNRDGYGQIIGVTVSLPPLVVGGL